MDEVSGPLATQLGVGQHSAETAVGIACLSKERSPDKIKLLPAKLPGAGGLVQKAARAGGNGMGDVIGDIMTNVMGTARRWRG